MSANHEEPENMQLTPVNQLICNSHNGCPVFGFVGSFLNETDPENYLIMCGREIDRRQMIDNVGLPKSDCIIGKFGHNEHNTQTQSKQITITRSIDGIVSVKMLWGEMTNLHGDMIASRNSQKGVVLHHMLFRNLPKQVKPTFDQMFERYQLARQIWMREQVQSLTERILETFHAMMMDKGKYLSQ